jgi:hypothetical protein
MLGRELAGVRGVWFACLHACFCFLSLGGGGAFDTNTMILQLITYFLILES